MLTSKTITDEQIRELHDELIDIAEDCVVARSSLIPKLRKKARTRCAKILKALNTK